MDLLIWSLGASILVLQGHDEKKPPFQKPLMLTQSSLSQSEGGPIVKKPKMRTSSSRGKIRLGTGEPRIEPPQKGVRQKKTSRDSQGSLEQSESAFERNERLLSEGIKNRPEAPPERDYLSVMQSRLSQSGAFPNLPPLLRMGFGFGSWFPLTETEGRKSTPLGAHHITAALWSSSKGVTESGFSQVLPISYGTLVYYGVSMNAEVQIAGFDTRGNSIFYSLLVDDFDSGIGYRHVFQWPAFGLMSTGLDLGLAIAYLPLRQRLLRQFGEGIPAESDYLNSGIQFNGTGGLAQFTLSAVVLSLFEFGIFAGVNSGFPAELKAWAGVELAFRSPRFRENLAATIHSDSLEPKKEEQK